MRTTIAAVLLLLPFAASALTPAAETLLRKLGLDPKAEEIVALAGDRVAAKSGELYTLDSLAAKGDPAAVKAFLVTREFFHEFRENPDIEFPNDESYDILYLSEEEKAYMAKKLMEGLPPAAMSPATAEYLRSIGIDPESEEVLAVHEEGPVKTTYNDDPVEYSLARLAAEKRKNGLATFIATRGFIRRLKKDYAGTSIPKTNYDPVYLTREELALVGRKFADTLFKKKG